MLNLRTQIGNYEFTNPLMNASGVNCFDKKDLDELSNSVAGSLITKSATVKPRQGNPEPRYADLTLGSINSMGLPNLGIDYYLEYVHNYQQQHPTDAIFMSIVGTTFEENIAVAHKIQDSDFNGLTEINLSCPNVPGEPQTAYDPKQTVKILDALFAFFTKPLGVKLPPFFDLAQFDQMAKILNKYPLTFINTMNSLGNGLMIDANTDTALVKPKGGFGGIGGAYAKPISLANVRAFRQRLRPEINIIGTGGVRTGRDVYELILCGADMVQVGTTLHKEGVDVFARLLDELKTELRAKGHEQLSDFRGQLRTL
ncbi:dihydroorotate oxidase [Lacticaseibacillus zhaodongensis]|uniref:dihydroorotate oxidase n=1 Tax=Lacticaseibacillus zhaodongensis TaxID=2668065 RepID=UPI0012D36D8A|nr:dihydroorotate oxidase [Lacticaseibacillus zhaodongensis]